MFIKIVKYGHPGKTTVILFNSDTFNRIESQFSATLERGISTIHYGINGDFLITLETLDSLAERLNHGEVEPPLDWEKRWNL